MNLFYCLNLSAMFQNLFLSIKRNVPGDFIGIIDLNTFSVAPSIIKENLKICYSLMSLFNPSTDIVPMNVATEVIQSLTFASNLLGIRVTRYMKEAILKGVEN
jgi:hypothetical protein